jgi:hypothetical protein
MPGRRIFISSLLAGLFSFPAASQDYFPLHEGNQWIWRSSDRLSQDVVTAEISQKAVFDGREYAMITGFFGRTAWVRMDPNGTLRAYDPQTKTEEVWADFAAPEGGSYRTQMVECSPKATVKSKAAQFKGRVGESQAAFEIVYPPQQCADAGLTTETYLPYIGLVERKETTFAGPKRYELIYARIGGVTVLADRELGFGMTLDRAVFQPADTVTVRFTLRNTSGRPVAVNFPSGQDFDVAIKDSKGSTVYVWSRNKLFTLVYRTANIINERNWVALLDGLTLAPGKYVAEGWLSTEPAKTYMSSVAFEVAEVVTQQP